MRFLAALIFTFLVTPAFGGMNTLSTPAVAVTTAQTVLCPVTNVSSKTFDVTVTIFASNGTNLDSHAFSMVAPGLTDQLGISSVIDTVRCAFTFSGSSKSIRASIEVTDSIGTPLVTLPAS